MEEVEDQRIMELIAPFFLENEFYAHKNKFKNEHCTVTVDLEEEYYIIEWKNNWMSTESLNLMYLVGVLVCQGLIKKDFKWKIK